MLEEPEAVSKEQSQEGDAPRWANVKSIFELAVTLESSEWPSFLDLRCGSDDRLRREVESLLFAHNSSSDFLENPLLKLDSVAPLGALSSPALPEVGTRVGAYQLEREIGHGGMGAVFLANRADEEFLMRVAIKFIRVEKHSDFAIRRFRQERQILARLEHPHVARLIDGGTTDTGMPYLVMEFVEGEGLTQYCDLRALPARERCELFVKICSAVQYAHERNVVHRDLKPANVLVDQSGSPKLLDFGIAKMLEPDGVGLSKEATLAGLRMLTPAYASPEQMQGDPVTAQSDVYSLGVILYELLCGERPSLRTVQQSSSSPGGKEEHLSPNLRAIIFNAIRLDPAERYQSVAALAEDLERYLKGFPTTAGFGAGLAQEPEQISIGVLPFRELGQDSAADPFLRSAITDALITRLSKVNRLSVRPTSAVLRYSDSKDVAHAARELRVRYLVEGTLHTVQNQIRLNVQLVSSDTGLAVWAARFDEQSSDLLRLEDSISEQIAFALIPQLTGEERMKLGRPGTTNGKAHEAYLRGRYHWSRSAGDPDELVKALVCFTKAIAEDPGYARAHAGIADYYVRLALWGGVPPAESFAAALAEARKALELDPGLGEAHATLGFCTWAYSRDYDSSDREFNIAIAQSPDSANAHHWFGLLNSARKRPELAIANLDRARKIDPNSPVIAAASGLVHYNAREYSKAIELLNAAARERKNSAVIQEMLAWTYLALSEIPQALVNAKRAAELSSRSASSLAVLARAEAVAGNVGAVTELLKEVEDKRFTRYVSGYDRASCYLAAGQIPQALTCLEEAFAARDWWIYWISVGARWDTLRDEPRFAQLTLQTQPAESIERTQTATQPAAAVSRFGKRQRFVATGALLAAAIVLLALFYWGKKTAPFDKVEFSKLTGDGTAGTVAISPDGQLIAYTTTKKGAAQVWRRKIGSSESVALTDAMPGGHIFNIEFTGGGKQIAYGLEPILQPYRRRLFILPVEGGTPAQILGEFSGLVGVSHNGVRAAVIRANRPQNRDELWITDIKSGEERLLVSEQYPNHLSSDAPPVWSRDDTQIGYAVETQDKTGFLINLHGINVATKKVSKAIAPRLLWVEHLAWVNGTAGLAVVARSEGSSFRQLWYVGFPGGPSMRLGNDLESYNGLSASDSGSAIVSVQLQTYCNIYLARLKDMARPMQITPGTGRYFDLSWTPEGKLLYASDATGEANVWSIRADGSDAQQIMLGPGLKWAPVASPDGKYLAFHSNQSGSWNVWRADSDGTHRVQITKGSNDSNWPHFTADSKSIVFHQTGVNGRWSMWRAPVDGGTAVQLTFRNTTHPAVSPRDGRIAAWYNESEANPQWKLAIFPPDGGEPLQVFTPSVAITPDSQLSWSPAGDAITCLGKQDGVWNLWMQPLDGRPAWQLTSFRSGQIYSFDWSKDGRLAFSHGETTNDVVIVRDKQRS